MNPSNNFRQPPRPRPPLKRPLRPIERRNANWKGVYNPWMIIGRLNRRLYPWENIRDEGLPGETGTNNLPKPEA